MWLFDYKVKGCNSQNSPQLLEELSTIEVPVERKLVKPNSRPEKTQPTVEKHEFDKAMAENVMATELLNTGIQKFAEDASKLKAWLKSFNRS